VNANDDDAVQFFANLCKRDLREPEWKNSYEQHQATNKHTLAVRSCCPRDKNARVIFVWACGVYSKRRVDTEASNIPLRNEVTEEGVNEGEEAEAAAGCEEGLRAAAERSGAPAKEHTTSRLQLCRLPSPPIGASYPLPSLYALMGANRPSKACHLPAFRTGRPKN